ncbi:MAG: hypothetical protein H6578_04485 [Chitinophagales bacterium]|nr:hypothetical protein [Chitinophagales bacterium]
MVYIVVLYIIGFIYFMIRMIFASINRDYLFLLEVIIIELNSLFYKKSDSFIENYSVKKDELLVKNRSKVTFFYELKRNILNPVDIKKDFALKSKLYKDLSSEYLFEYKKLKNAYIGFFYT